MFENAGSLLPEKLEFGQSDGRESSVWVEADFLRRFLSCDNDLDQRLRSSGPLLRHKSLLCEHTGLHPRVARRGKLLSKSGYDAYVSLLKGERALMREECETAMEETDIIDSETEITAANMFCSKCSRVYRDQLEKKLNLLQNIKALYDALDTLNDDSPLAYEDGEEPDGPAEDYAYVVSRQSVTKYRKVVAALMKTLSKLDDGAPLGATSGDPVIFEGLDALDISPFEMCLGEEYRDRKQTETGNDEEPDKLDKLFNSNITCEFRNPRTRFSPSSLISANSPLKVLMEIAMS
jgi:hypothetical protein